MGAPFRAPGSWHNRSMATWRTVCEQTLREFTEADSLRFWGFGHREGEGTRPVFDYRFEHTLAVVKLARWLSPQVGADLDVVEAAAWLHDCRKCLKDPRSKDHHAQEGAEAAGEILAATDFPPARIPAVQQAIRLHVGLRLAHRLEPLEAACLWDCDKLSKIGAASLVHFQGISGAFQPLTTEDLLRRGEAWLPLAEGIAASMNTPPAQAEALKRLTFLKDYYRRLRCEWEEDLPC